MIKRIKFPGIPVGDQERPLQFYTEKLSFRVFTDQQFSETQRWIELSIPGAETGIVLFTPQGHEDRIGTFMNTSWEVDNVEKTYEELQSRGVEFTGLQTRLLPLTGRIHKRHYCIRRRGVAHEQPCIGGQIALFVQ